MNIKKRFSHIGSLLIALTLVQGVVGQELPKPGPEHELLKQMEGTWMATVKMEGNESKATATYKMDLGGLWLLSEFDGEFFGQKFEGRGMDTYNSAKGKYVSVWVDSMTTQPLVMEGTFDKEKKTLTMKGDAPGPDGRPYKGVTEILDDDHQKFTMYVIEPDGDEIQMMQIDYRRKK